MIRVLVVDDHIIVRNGLEQLLSTEADLDLVGSAGDGAAAVALLGTTQVDVVLMDLSMPVMDGVTATGVITARFPSTRVLVLTSHGDQQRIVDALDAGAVGYLLKHADPDQIIAAIRTVHAGGSPLDPQAARVLLEQRRARSAAPAATESLTEREVEVLTLVKRGLANKQIARSLGITERTVKAHLTNVFQRLGVSDRTQAALWAERHLNDHSG